MKKLITLFFVLLAMVVFTSVNAQEVDTQEEFYLTVPSREGIIEYFIYLEGESLAFPVPVQEDGRLKVNINGVRNLDGMKFNVQGCDENQCYEISSPVIFYEDCTEVIGRSEELSFSR